LLEYTKYREFTEYFDAIPEVMKMFNGSDEEEGRDQQLARLQKQAHGVGIKGPPNRI